MYLWQFYLLRDLGKAGPMIYCSTYSEIENVTRFIEKASEILCQHGWFHFSEPVVSE